MKLFCQGCGGEFEGKGTDRYCSDECRENTRKTREQASKEGARKMFPKTCPFCGKEFIPPHRQDQIYCSDVCRDKAKWEKKKRVLTERICLVCGKEFMPTVNKQVCCSPECTFKKIYLENPEKKKKQAKQWRLDNPERVKENNRHKREENPELYKQIEQRSRDKVNFSGNKSIALERDGYKCTRCGATENLAMHHKDGSGQTDHPNNDLDNLETLCSSCHTLHHNPRLDTTPHVTNNCLYCGNDIRVSQVRVENERGKFCDKKCAAKYKTKNNTVTLNCEHCGIEFTVPLSRFKRGKVKYHDIECRKAAGYAWTNK